MVTGIMAEILFALVLVNEQTHQGRFSKPILTTITDEASAKRLLGRKAFEEMLQRLDALTGEESQMIVAQTLEVVSGLVTRTRVFMDGVHWLFKWRRACYLTPFCLRSQRLDGQHPTNPGCVPDLCEPELFHTAITSPHPKNGKYGSQRRALVILLCYLCWLFKYKLLRRLPVTTRCSTLAVCPRSLDKP